MSILPVIKNRNKGQVLVIFAVAIFALLILVGLAIDGTQLFLNYTRLKRAVDAAAVAAANDFRKTSSLEQMKQSAIEILDMQQVTDIVDIKFYRCDTPNIQTDVPNFYSQCPQTGQLQKKLVYVQAFENSPTVFVTLIGIHSIPITTNAISEAAPVDLVIVLDTSESMGRDTPGFSANDGDFSPVGCNTAHNCLPLQDAKNAAKTLINSLYSGYDRVSIVSFDTVGQVRFSLSTECTPGDPKTQGDPSCGNSILDNNVPLHDDPFPGKLFSKVANYGTNAGRFNPINPEDRNNDGSDDDEATASTFPCDISDPLEYGWDAVRNIPCDNKDFLDAFDWDGDHQFSSGTGTGYACTPAVSDECVSQRWIADHNATDPTTGLPYNPPLPISVVSTCTGCGIRVAANELIHSGRTNAVWVMVFLSDGVANMSDTSVTFRYDPITKVGVNPAYYPNGYCGGHIVIDGVPAPVAGAAPNYWLDRCQDNTNQRHCINAITASCPPNSKPSTPPYSPFYSVLDYAKDQTDAAALRVVASGSQEKPAGNDIAIYTIMFGDLAPQGAPLLRYMAAVGDDGDRRTDPCAPYEPGSPTYDENDPLKGPKKSCGQYYFAKNAAALGPVFHDIASRIYTKISE